MLNNSPSSSSGPECCKSDGSQRTAAPRHGSGGFSWQQPCAKHFGHNLSTTLVHRHMQRLHCGTEWEVGRNNLLQGVELTVIFF
jgi:hypothetical protein